MSSVALDLLAYAIEQVETEHRFPSAREIAERFGWASPAAPYRHLRHLAAAGFIEPRPGGRYRIARLADGTAATFCLVPVGTRARSQESGSSYKRPGPFDRCATEPVRDPRDFRWRFIGLARQGRGSPGQQLAGRLLATFGDDALRHLPADAPASARHILEGCACTPETEATDA